MSDNAKRGKPRYEAPTVVPLGGLAQGMGYCTVGSNANDGYCTAGTVASAYCTDTGSAAGTACTAGGTAVTEACSAGTLPGV